MNLEKAYPIADAVLYEGHILYPYRPSARKNQVRWTFGGVHPRAYSEASGGLEPCHMQVQCLLRIDRSATLAVRVRFLHAVHRQVLKLVEPPAELPASGLPASEAVERLLVSGVLHQTWDEVEERAIETEVAVAELLRDARQLPIDFAARISHEAVRELSGLVVAVLERRQATLVGDIVISAEQLREDVVRVTVRVTNETPLSDAEMAQREPVMRSSLVSTHAILGVEGGSFVSLTDPPEELADLARGCEHQGAWPVMVGDPGDTSIVLATPIILEDYPQIAPESDTPLFDSGEIDEILLLRIMTMTDEEKVEARNADPGVAAMLDRAEAMNADDLMRMHGTTRTLRPSPGYV
ncbi:MAG: hypothetical protein ACR2MY_06385 [Candidatus Dormibacteria bacterium]